VGSAGAGPVRRRRRLLTALVALVSVVVVAGLGWVVFNETFLASAREVRVAP
jgi:hypothetical protein